MIKIYPYLQSITYLSGYTDLSLLNKITLGKINNEVFVEELKKINPHFNFVSDNQGDICFIENTSINNQYQININNNQIKIYYHEEEYAFYAVQTLKQLFKITKVENCNIIDYPSLKTRGLMIDISRDKVPTLATLKQIVDDMVNFKFNHLELYVEGFSFEYQSFKELIDIDHNYITLKEYLELEDYANKRYIDLVPNQNGFGHMAPWLEHYNELAECPDGAVYWGSKRAPATLDPSNPESFELVKKMYQDMIPHFKSKYFNMNFDEPMELGMGKSKAIVEQNGIQNVYLNYLNKCVDEIKNTYHKIPMCWGDVLIKHPDTFDKIPKDLIFLDWGYDHTYDFERHAKALKEHQIKFMLAPGTSTWACVTGKYLDMYGSIIHAAEACKKYDGLGILITDWGDFGHLQYLPFSYAGFILGLCKAWNNIEEQDIKEVMKMFFNPVQIECLLDLAHIHELEGPFPGYGNRMFMPIMFSTLAQVYLNQENNNINILDILVDKLKYNQIDAFHQKLLNDELSRIQNKINSNSQDLVDQEILNSIHLLKSLISISDHLITNTGDIHQDIKNLENYSMKHSIIWNARNKTEGYKLSNQKITNLIHMLLKQIERRENI